MHQSKQYQSVSPPSDGTMEKLGKESLPTSAHHYDYGLSGPHQLARKDLKWYHHVADLANILKAFVGTNYLSLAFGLKQAGIGLGFAGLVLIAGMTAHCCQLIVKVKYHAIESLINKRMYDDKQSHTEVRERMQKHLTYADLGKITFGRVGQALVNGCLLLTQIGFCIVYHIFIGQTIYSMVLAGSVETGNVTVPHTNLHRSPQLQSDALSIGSPAFTGGGHLQSPLLPRFEGMDLNDDSLASNDTILTQSTPVIPSENWEISKSSVLDVSTPSLPPSLPDDVVTTTQPLNKLANGWLPPLEFLVLTPLPLFVIFVLFRKVRLMGPISLVANGTMTAGYFAVVVYIIIGFRLAPDFEWAKWATFPVFLGQAASSYEAIGTILSIEASMEGNHHRFPAFLDGVVVLFSMMTIVSSVLGYLRYGHQTEQILLQNLPQNSTLVLVIDIALIIAILCTYPLQVYPVIEIMEGLLFAEGQPCGPKMSKRSSSGSVDEGEETDLLLGEDEDEDAEAGPHGHIGKTVPSSVATWKRNVFRVGVALFIGGMAVVLKDIFAYVNAFVGALGSCPLVFILPCLFHLKLCRHQLSTPVIIKDIVFIVVGAVICVVSVVVVVQQVAAGIT